MCNQTLEAWAEEIKELIIQTFKNRPCVPIYGIKGELKGYTISITKKQHDNLKHLVGWK